MRFSSLVRSTSLRVALIEALIIAAAFFFTGAAVRSAIHHMTWELHTERLRAEAEDLRTAARRGGVDAVYRELQQRRARPGMYYRLVDGRGVVLLDMLNAEKVPLGWSELDWDKRRGAAPVFSDIDVLTQRLDNGALVSVGADHQREEGLRRTLMRELLAAGGAAAGGALIASIIASAGILRRVDRLARLTREVASGRLGERVPVNARGGDDIDALSRGVNAMLDEISELVTGLRAAGSAIAHDLRTPLTRLGHQLERLRAPELDADVREALTSQAQADLRESLRMMDALLRLNEIDGGAGLVLHRFRLDELALTMADAYRPDIEDNGRTLATEVQPVQILGDQDLLGLALANLIENAITHTPSGARICVRVAISGSCAELSVADTGPGIPAEARSRVLRRFERLQHSRSTPGFGLGLAIVAAVARRHGADLQLDDARPGLIVRLLFPRDRDG